MKDLFYIFKFKSSIVYKLLYIVSLIRKVIGKIFFGRFKSSYINTNQDYIIENENGKYKVFEPSDMHAILKPYNEDELEKYFQLDGGVFLDIGGNVGKYSVFVGKQNKNNSIYTFEPNSNIYNNYLLENIKLNNLTNVNIFNIGLSNKEGELDLFIPEGNNFGSASLLPNQHKNEKKVVVKLNTLDNFIEDNSIDESEIRLIKIDVEGFEINVLRGGLNVLKKLSSCKIIIEISKDYHEINELIIGNGFSLEFSSGINYVYSI